MRKALLWTGVVVLALALGVGGAAGAGVLIERSQEKTAALAAQSGTTPDDTVPFFPFRGTDRQRRMPGFGNSPRGGQEACPFDGFGGMPGGMMRSWREYGNQNGTCPLSGRGRTPRGGMRGYGAVPSTTQGERLTLDAAVEKAQSYAQSLDQELTVSEVMEFDQNFYALLTEKETGRGALEVLIDPITGAVHPEPGPSMMWNLKYGHMRGLRTEAVDNSITLEAAREKAQQYLDDAQPGAVLAEGGVSFYGYYTLDYQVDGKPAGMLSVNGLSGQVWPHTWHGAFVAEKEIAQ
jgi:hypothetical protein